ncbi:hypothetical protein MMC25_007877 [Agyrium rufum]|nr:hypothetical protein [Agyrium rufum]
MAEVEQRPVQDASLSEPTTSMAPEASSEPMATTETVPAMASEATEPPATEPMKPVEEKVGDKDVNIEAQPASEGILGHKGPGLIKSFRFIKEFFWFSDEAAEPTTLSGYVRAHDKPEIGAHNAAHATQTGKGLLFHAKRAEDKPTPSGILNLSEAVSVTKLGHNEFCFYIHNQKHTFQAANANERDSWIVAVEKAITDGKADLEDIKGSDGYKEHKKNFLKPAGYTAGGVAAGGVVAAKAANPSKPTTTEDKPIEDKTETEPVPAATTQAATEPSLRPTEKSRSQSRKRTSIFGKVLGKKDEMEEKKDLKKEEKKEAKEEKKEEKAEAKEEKAEEKALAKEEKKEEKAEAKEEKKEEKAQQKAEKAEAKEEKKEEKAEAKEEKKEEKAEKKEKAEAPKAKRASVFGGLFSRKESQAGPKETPKEAPMEAPVEAAIPAEAPMMEAPREEAAPAVPSKDVEPAPVSETAPTLDNPVSNIPIEITGVQEAGNEAAAADTSATSAATKPATTPEATKEKRRQSFFNLAGKKDKKVDATSDAEGTDGEGKKENVTSKLTGIFRKASRSNKGGSSGPVTDASTPPPISKDLESAAETKPPMETATEAPAAAEPTMLESTEAPVTESTHTQPSAVSASA